MRTIPAILFCLTLCCAWAARAGGRDGEPGEEAPGRGRQPVAGRNAPEDAQSLIRLGERDMEALISSKIIV